jgi:hypothetical protein
VHDLVAIHFVLLRAAQFANPKNPHCFPMATLQAGKLANSLMPNTSHFSLGSANDHNGLAGHGTRPVQNRSNIALRISGAAPPAAPCRRPGSAGRRRLCPERAPRRSRATRRRRLYERENVRFAPKATRWADFVVKVAGEPGPDRMSGISRPAAGKNATFRFRN